MIELTKMSKRVRVKAAITRFRGQAMIDTPEGNLMFAIFTQALNDLTASTQGKRKNEPLNSYLSRKANIKAHRDSAMRYMEGEAGDIIHAQLCGLDPDWIRSTLLHLNLWPSNHKSIRDK